MCETPYRCVFNLYERKKRKKTCYSWDVTNSLILVIGTYFWKIFLHVKYEIWLGKKNLRSNCMLSIDLFAISFLNNNRNLTIQHVWNEDFELNKVRKHLTKWIDFTRKEIPTQTITILLFMLNKFTWLKMS